ncbi:MAG TPA: class 1 fructose-bisphosphatase [Planctomycetota bacterium]|nr:class 1 fructose-bisphosphatase [Planctomycetota bacterium]
MSPLTGEPLQITTIERHILDQQHKYPDATGDLTNILYDMALCGKLIASKVIQAGLTGVLGSANERNVQGEEVMRMDKFADSTIYRLNDHTGRLAVMGSEEHDEILPIPSKYKTGRYVLLFDPLDGSSNIDVNVSVGTIFAIYRRKSKEGPGTLEDCLQPGKNLVAAGYVIYGSSTMLVYTTGNGVHGFTLNRMVGEFLLSHPNIRMPEKAKYYSVNSGNEKYWSPGVLRYMRYLQGGDEEIAPLSARYIGSLVADFHRNLLSGGVFFYPADRKDPKKPHGKLRMAYEAAPLAFIAEQAGGYASDGRQRILDIEPSSLHQRTPLFIGDKNLVLKAEEFIAKFDK